MHQNILEWDELVRYFTDPEHWNKLPIIKEGTFQILWREKTHFLIK